MLVSEKWLREFVSPNKTTQEIADQLTMAGLEVDGIERIEPQFTQVVVAKITAIEQHPDAQKLRVCQVFDGVETSQVVCGAPNAREGLVVAFAKVGAKLPELKIKKAKLRGVESFGMLCGEPELLLGADDSGLMELAENAQLGMPLEEYYGLDDSIIEVDLTPNRADCFSMLGVARDLAAINDQAFAEPIFESIKPVINNTIAVSRHVERACPRYVSRVIHNVDLSQASPVWMQEKLRRAGLRSIDAVVDVTNYVLMELGQPLHAFDKNLLSGDITVRMAEQGEKISLLNDQNVSLNNDTLVIADGSGAIAIAGVMGGSTTAVNTTTKDIVLEAAFFDRVTIAGKARAYGLHTDSSMRFERGVDFLGQERAIERATQLLLDIVGGEPGPVVVSESPEHLKSLDVITLRKQRVEQITGLTITDERLVNIFTGLGCQVNQGEATFEIKPPSWRFDFAIEADLIEEVARLVGYNELPVCLPTLEANLPDKSEAKLGLDTFKDRLVGLGYQEVITYSFISPELHNVFFDSSSVLVQNPISADMSSMRTSLIPGLVNTALYNINRQQKRLSLFEAGLTFLPQTNGLPKQDIMIAGLLTGDVHLQTWTEKSREADFFDIKGDLEALLSHLSHDLSFERADLTYLHPGQSANILSKDKVIGHIGAIHPSTAQKAGLSQQAYVFELNVSEIEKKEVAVFSEISRFPEVRRDLAIIVGEAVSADQIESVVKLNAGEYFKSFNIFDVYQGKGIELQRKSIALGLTFQSKSSTLTDDTINQIIDKVIHALSQDLNAVLRS